MNERKSEIRFDRLPFWRGVCGRPAQPEVLPFELGWDDRGFVRQIISEDVRNKVVDGYNQEDYSFITQPPGSSSWANRLGDIYLESVERNLPLLKGKRILD